MVLKEGGIEVKVSGMDEVREIKDRVIEGPSTSTLRAFRKIKRLTGKRTLVSQAPKPKPNIDEISES